MKKNREGGKSTVVSVSKVGKLMLKIPGQRRRRAVYGFFDSDGGFCWSVLKAEPRLTPEWLDSEDGQEFLKWVDNFLKSWKN